VLWIFHSSQTEPIALVCISASDKIHITILVNM